VTIFAVLFCLIILGVISYPPTATRLAYRLLRWHKQNEGGIAQEQNELAFALLDTAIALTSTLELEVVVDHVLTNLERVVAHHEANIMVLDGNEAIMLGRRFNGKKSAPTNQRIPLVGAPYPNQMIATKQPVIVADVAGDTKLVRLTGKQPISVRSYIGVPIILEDKVIGFINLSNKAIGYFTETHARYLQIFAFQTGVAIKNAQLYSQAQSVATRNERERIARELHDKVTQILFSANAVAEALPRLLDRKPEKAHTYLQELIQFTRAAMANMRSLLVELHPESLEKTDLTILINQLGDALAGNQKINITYKLMDKVLLPLHYQTAIYRIVQEALNNVAAHASATQVEIKLERTDNMIELVISDNGIGFDTALQSEDQLGLNIMQERAHEIGAHLEIKSQQNEGTQVILRGIIVQ
jgi:signal transduction histidine kinase